MRRGLLAIAVIVLSVVSVPINAGVIDITRPNSRTIEIRVGAGGDSLVNQQAHYDNCFAPQALGGFERGELIFSCDPITTGVVTIGPFTVFGAKQQSTIPAFHKRVASVDFDVVRALREAVAAGGPAIVLRPREKPLEGAAGVPLDVRVILDTSENLASIRFSAPEQDGLAVADGGDEGWRLQRFGLASGVGIQELEALRLAVTPRREGVLTLQGIKLFVRYWSASGTGIRPGFSAPLAEGDVRETTIELPPLSITATAAAPSDRPRATEHLRLDCATSHASTGRPVWVRVEAHFGGRREPLPPPRVAGAVVEANVFSPDSGGNSAMQTWLLRFDPAAVSRPLPEIRVETWDKQKQSAVVASCTPEGMVQVVPPPEKEAPKQSVRAAIHSIRIWTLTTVVCGFVFVGAAALRLLKGLSRSRS